MGQELSTITDSDALKRIVRLTRDGFVRIDQRIRAKGTERGTDVTGRYWFLGIVTVHSGTIRFRHGDTWISPSSNPFAMFVPPYQLVEAELRNLSSTNRAIALARALPKS